MQPILFRTIVIALLLSGLGAIWEGFWWHEFVGIDLVGAPPHLFYHISLLIAFAASCVQWLYYKQASYRSITILFACALLTIPYGIWWDAQFDLGNRASLLLYTSSHYVFFGVLHFVISACLLQKELRLKNTSALDTVLSILLCSEILLNVLIRIRPLYPTGGIHALMGFWGVGIITLLVVCTLLIGKQFVPVRWASFKIIMGYLFVYVLHWLLGYKTFAAYDLPTTIIDRMIWGGFRDPPFWLTLMGLLDVAIPLDVIKKPTVSVAVCFGVFYGLFVYGLGLIFIDTHHVYGLREICIAAFSSGVGAALAVVIIPYVHSEQRTLFRI